MIHGPGWAPRVVRIWRNPAAPYAGDGSSVPRVIARGRGELAERILAVAEEHGVPVRRDPDLLQLLAVSQVGDEIPTEVYGAVAQLISFL